MQTIQKAKKYLKSSYTTQTNPLLMWFLRHYILVKRVISENMQKMQKKKNEGEIESSQTEWINDNNKVCTLIVIMVNLNLIFSSNYS